MKYTITAYNDNNHRSSVIDLWEQIFGYEAEHNKPETVIDKKLEINDNLFFVAMNESCVVGTVMAGYDGHRGWIYSIAVAPDSRHQGIGSRLLSFAEKKLASVGCMKINLQIMAGNEAVEYFYLSSGYHTEKRISMGKKIPDNIPG